MEYKNILAATLNLPIDNDKITQEILSCKDSWVCTPARDNQLDNGLKGKIFMSSTIEDYTNCDYSVETGVGTNIRVNIKKDIPAPYIFYLTSHPNEATDHDPYRKAKTFNKDLWKWRDDLVDKIPYLKSVVEKYFTKISIVRVFVMDNTFLVTHRDHSREASINYVSDEYDVCLGLSIIPSDGNVPMKIWSGKEQKVLDIPGNAMIFNDSAPHGVPKTTGYRITIRIFGEIDYSQFDDLLDLNHIHFI